MDALQEVTTQPETAVKPKKEAKPRTKAFPKPEKKTWKLAADFNAVNIKVLYTRNPMRMVWAYDGEYMGKKSFHIREVYQDDNEEWRPGKGFSVPLEKKSQLVGQFCAQLQEK